MLPPQFSTNPVYPVSISVMLSLQNLMKDPDGRTSITPSAIPEIKLKMSVDGSKAAMN